MKVVSGIYKGRKIEGYNIEGTRPTMDRVKESLFATIQEYVKGSVILDLFSGSGNLAIEALSAQAKYAYIVDNNKIAIATIKKNIANLSINNCKIIKNDFKKALELLKSTKMDIIFLDPPYNTNYIEESIKQIETNNILAKKGLIICESNNLNKIVYSSNFKVLKEKKYGDKWVVILQQI